MTKKKLRFAFNSVLNIAEKAECKDLHHKKGQYHNHDFICPVEYEIGKNIEIVRQYMEDNEI